MSDKKKDFDNLWDLTDAEILKRELEYKKNKVPNMVLSASQKYLMKENPTYEPYSFPTTPYSTTKNPLRAHVQDAKDKKLKVKGAIVQTVAYGKYKALLKQYQEKIDKIKLLVPKGQKAKDVFTDERVKELEDLNNAISDLKSQMKDISIDFYSKNKDSKDKIVQKFSELQVDKINYNVELQSIFNTPWSEEVSGKLMSIFPSHLSSEQKKFASTNYFANPYGDRNIIRKDADNINNYDPNTYVQDPKYPNDPKKLIKGGKRIYNQQEINAINAMERASLSPGAAKAREDSGMSDRSNRMGTTDWDSMYKEARKKGYSINNAEIYASIRIGEKVSKTERKEFINETQKIEDTLKRHAANPARKKRASNSTTQGSSDYYTDLNKERLFRLRDKENSKFRKLLMEKKIEEVDPNKT